MSPARSRKREAPKQRPAPEQSEPSAPPNPGSVYQAHRSILIGGDAHEAKRRIVCIKSPPGPPDMWITLGRSSTDHRPGDLESPEQPNCSFDKKGWFSMRFKHTIYTEHLGNVVNCPYQGELFEESRAKLLAYYHDNS